MRCGFHELTTKSLIAGAARKLNLLTFKADDTSDEEAREKIKRRYHSLAKRWHQTDSDELLERFLTAVTSSYDPHTTYMSPSSLDNFRIMMRLNLDGIGARCKSLKTVILW